MEEDKIKTVLSKLWERNITLFILAGILEFSFIATMTHEFGHFITAWLTGGQAIIVDWDTCRVSHWGWGMMLTQAMGQGFNVLFVSAIARIVKNKRYNFFAASYIIWATGSFVMMTDCDPDSFVIYMIIMVINFLLFFYRKGMFKEQAGKTESPSKENGQKKSSVVR